MTELIELYTPLKIELPDISREAYLAFCRFFARSGLPNSEFGKLFYIHFTLAHVDDQTQVSKIYPLGKEEANKLISEIFNISTL